MKNIWNVCVIFVLAFSALRISVAAEKDKNSFDVPIKEIVEHFIKLNEIIPNLSNSERTLYSLAYSETHLALAGFKHLADLEKLDRIVHEEASRITLRKMLYHQRFQQKWNCRFSISTLAVAEENNSNPVFRGKIAALKKTLSDACKLVKPEDSP